MANDWAAIAGQVIRAGAPVLGGILGGPVGGMAGDVIGNLLGGALGVPATPAAVGAAIAADTVGATNKLGPLDQLHGDAMTELEARLQDVASAREQTIDLAKASSPIAWGAPVISTIVTLGFVGMTGYTLYHGASDNQVANTLVGALSAGFTSVLAYWLGSSYGSKSKDSTLADTIKTASEALARTVRK